MKSSKILAAAIPLAILPAAFGDITTSTIFSTNPLTSGSATVIGDASRFTYDSASHTITAAYNSNLPTAELVFPLAAPITQNQSFSYSTTFTINSISNFNMPGSTTAPFGTNEIAFGLLNSSLTGTDRNNNSYDIAESDYFPDNTGFGMPTLAPTLIKSSQSAGDFDNQIGFDFSGHANIDNFLNTGVPINATFSYNAATQLVSATFTASQLTIDPAGSNTQTDSFTLDLSNGGSFDFDEFGIMLWNDSEFIDDGSDAPLTASVTFSGFSVTSSAPEPASLALLAAGGLLLLRRRRIR